MINFISYDKISLNTLYLSSPNKIFDFSKNKVVLIALVMITLFGAALSLLHVLCKKRLSQAKPKESFSKDLKNLKMGYAIIPLVDNDSPNALFKASMDFHAQSEAYKKQFIVKDRVEIGYSSMKKKNVFVVRSPNVPKELKPLIPYIEKVHQKTLDILKFIEKNLHLSKGQLTQTASLIPFPKGGESTSLLRLFAYDPSTEEGIAAEAHQDLGLLTIILRSTEPSLEVAEYGENIQWKNIEKIAQPIEAVVLVGRTLEQMTDGRYLAATHQVINSQKERFSLVYQLRAEPQAKISTNSGKISVDEWLINLKKGLTSINGSY